jgi:hypothetical protein
VREQSREKRRAVGRAGGEKVNGVLDPHVIEATQGWRVELRAGAVWRSADWCSTGR